VPRGLEADRETEVVSADAPGRAGASLSRGFVLLLAVATGVSVASDYYVQPLLAIIRHSFGVGSGAAGLIVTASQIGYAAGLLLLVPLGDLLERRRLVVVMSCVTAASLIGMATAPSLILLYVFSAIAGATSVVAQVLVAFSASLAQDRERGRVVGTVMSGLLLGILLARTVSGYVAAASSWRVVYFMAAGVMVVLAVVLWRVLPRYREDLGLSYPEVLASVARIFRQEPLLRRRALYGALSFAAFTVLWTSLAFLLAAPPYRYGAGTIGLFGLAGVAGAAMASVAGRLADQGRQAIVTVAAALAILLAFVMLAVKPRDLGVLVAGIVLLDLGSQGLHITNQSEIYRLAGAARSRVNSAYMTCYFVGGTLGSIGAAITYADFGWAGPAGLGTGLGALGFLFSLTERRFGQRDAQGSELSTGSS
jgi:predicted MFS family arabinose efflux permease